METSMTQPMLYPELYKTAIWGLGGMCSILCGVLMLLYRGALGRIEILEGSMSRLLTDTLPKEYARKDDMKHALDAIHSSIRDASTERKAQIEHIAGEVSSAMNRMGTKLDRLDDRINSLIK
jgi:hypothetical protein